MTKTNSNLKSKISFKREIDRYGWTEYHFNGKNGGECVIKNVHGIFSPYWGVFMNECEIYRLETLSKARDWAKNEIISRGWVK